MKKVALLIDTMNGGGAQRVVSHLSHILDKDYEAHVILFEDTYMEYSCAGTIHNLNVPAEKGNIFAKLKLLSLRVKRLRTLIQEEGFDCVISFMDSPNFVNLFARVKGCRKLISIRNFSGLENRQSGLGKIVDQAMKLLYRRADGVITVSKLIEKDFQEHYGIPNEKLHTIYNPYNFAEIHEKGVVPLNQEEQAFYRDSFVFINVGRVMYQKGHWHLVKAFSLVQKKHPQAKLVIVGEDLSQGKLPKLIEDLKLQDSVLLTGRTRNPYQYMKNADCYVLSSLFEGFPNAMVEAMACECAIIAADCKSGPREILFEDADLDMKIDTILEADYGILVPELEQEENWDAAVITDAERLLSKAMEQVLDGEDYTENLAKKARVCSSVFGYDAAKEAFKEIIH